MLSCIIAIFDFLPVFGIDMIMIPWIVICAFTNKISLALGLLIIYLVIVITKNILEPKLIAKGLGISPVSYTHLTNTIIDYFTVESLTVDMSKLKQLIALIEQENMNEADYTVESWKTFKIALDLSLIHISLMEYVEGVKE